MRKFRVYMTLQLKRGIRQLPKVLLFTVILGLTAIVLCTVLLNQNENSEKKTMLKVGITGDLDDPYLRLGILAIKEFDSSNTYVEFISMSEKKAEEGLRSGYLSGYLSVPENFVDAIMNGGEIELTFVSINSPVGLGPILSNEVVQAASDLVKETMAGIIATQKIAREEKLTDDMGALTEDINIHYVAYVLDRDSLYEVKYTGVNNGLSFGGYYVCGILFLLILLMGITCAPMMVRDNSSLTRLANARGIGVIKQVLSEFAGFVLSPMIVLSLIMLILFGVADGNTMPIPELNDLDLSVVYKMMPVVLLLGAMQMLLYECSTGIIGGVILQFVTTIGLAYISGCFYPPYFFPESVQLIASYLPGGVALGYISGVFNHQGGGLAMLMSYFAVLLILVCIVRTLRLKGESK